MTKVKWVIEDYEHDSSLQPLMDEIEAQGMEYKVPKYVPWRGGTYDVYPNEDCVVFYGTLNLGYQLQKEKGWVPGVYCNRQNFCCVTYYSYWAQYLLNHDYIILPLLEIKRRENFVFDMFGIDNCVFIRPDSGAKTFTGGILKREEIDREFESFQTYSGMPLDQIFTIISTPKVVKKEWRLVVVDKSVLTCCQYHTDGKLDVVAEEDKNAIFLAERMARGEWQPDRAYTLDICLSNGEYYLLEANSFSCSGLYESNPVPIVREVSRVALEEWEEYYTDPCKEENEAISGNTRTK
tara:strand:- start:2568 stop:3449 length:882 start_codon:yes stop_codon:yes gene_type:complete